MKADLYKVIHEIWEKKQRVTHREFMDCLYKIHPSDDTITKPTFSRLLQDFMENNGITKYKNDELQIILHELIEEAIQKGISGLDELKNYVKDFLRIRKIYSPSHLELDRIISNIAKNTTYNAETENINNISKIIGKDIPSLEFIKEFEIKNQYIQFPPVYEGKLSVKKITSEYNILLQIKAIFQK